MKNYLIYGLQKSGQSAFNFLYNLKDKFYLLDLDPKKQEELLNKFDSLSNVYILKSLPKEILCDIDEMIISPGVSIGDKYVKLAKKLKIKVIPEIELGYENTSNEIIAVTGTNGKTTTVSLITNILNNAKIKAEKVGNIGIPFCDKIKKGKCKFVLEASSFQLESITNFHPKISCILNITPDHLDRHKCIKNYKLAKFNIFKNQNALDFLVINENLKVKSKAKIFTFGYKETNNGCYFSNDNFIFVSEGKKEVVMSKDCVNLIGKHNYENIMCAIIVCKLYKVKNEIIKKCVREFALENHRLQKVYQYKNNMIFDDSKATNIDACKRGMEAVGQFGNFKLILGGSKKGYNYDLLFRNFPKGVTKIVACGEASNEIKRSHDKKRCKIPLEIVKTLREATFISLQDLKDNESLLLSPACASFDEFKNYKERGEKFLEYVKEYYESYKKE